MAMHSKRIRKRCVPSPPATSNRVRPAHACATVVLLTEMG